MTLAGVWQGIEQPVTLHVEGREPSYAFRFVMLGTIVSKGTLARNPDRSHLATGQGVNGPVRD